jgi:predicted small lipoprotein YifL
MAIADARLYCVRPAPHGASAVFVRNAMRRLLYAVLLSLGATTLAGCGNKGPLTLPAPRPTTSAPASVPAPASSSLPAPDAARH